MILNSRKVISVLTGLFLASGVATAQEAKAPPKPNVKAYGNWSVLCPPDGDTSGVPCAMQLSMVDKKRKVAVIVWRIGFNKKGELLFDLGTPTEVMIKDGVRLSIGKSKPIRLAYVSCGLRGCESRAKVGGELIAAMKTAKQATLTLAPTNGKTLQINLDVSGLGAALAVIGVP
jgi:invasion protein IalB